MTGRFRRCRCDVFDSIDGTSLYATAASLVLLIIIYRSRSSGRSVFAVIMASHVAGRRDLLAEARRNWAGGGTAGVGVRRRHRLRVADPGATARSCAATRESTTRCGSRRARPAGDRRLGPTVTVASHVVIAEVTSTVGLGPIGAMGVGPAMVSMLTVPARSRSPAAGALCCSFRGWAARDARPTARGAGSPRGRWRPAASGSVPRPCCWRPG